MMKGQKTLIVSIITFHKERNKLVITGLFSHWRIHASVPIGQRLDVIKSIAAEMQRRCHNLLHRSL